MIVLVALVTLDPGVHRGVVVMLLPVAAPALVVDNALAGWATSTMYLGHTMPLVPA